MKKKKEKQSEATKFLERNKIWFTAVIPTFISIGVAGAGIASCQADFKQIELTNLEIEEKNMKNNRFSLFDRILMNKEINIFIKLLTQVEKFDIVIFRFHHI